MGFFDEEKGVRDYIKMAEGFDGRNLIKILKKHLPENSSLLELGMGPGKDLDILAQSFEVTGSDLSDIFLELYRKNNPNADVMHLDALTLITDRTFDCIYSNKVLHHLRKNDLITSFKRQRELLKKNGLLMHSFWHGDSEEEIEGLRFVYYLEDKLLAEIGAGFEVVESKQYEELESDDSFFLILRKV
jgi:cyclopropane fatty-acyl-phospholipid synthase-like methyltransferase